MSPRDDDRGVQASRDEAAIAGRAMTGEDAALAELAVVLREGARRPAPAPSTALAAMLTEGLSTDSTSHVAEVEVVDLGAARARRLAARYVVGAGVAVGLALGGTAAAAAVRDGVPLREVPGEVGHRISQTVTGALESIGLRQTAPADQVPDPRQGPADDGAPGPSDRAPGHQDETDGGGTSDMTPGAPAAPSDPGEGAGRSDDTQGRPDRQPEPGVVDQGRDGDETGRQGSTGGTDTGGASRDGDGDGQGQGPDADAAASPMPAARP